MASDYRIESFNIQKLGRNSMLRETKEPSLCLAINI